MKDDNVVDKKTVEKNRKNLLEKLELIKGKKIGEIDKYHILDNSKNKGNIGQVIQKYLGKDLDSNPDMDFPEAQLELKVTGLLENKNKNKFTYRAKERLVLTDINYINDYHYDFENSHLLQKCNDLLISCYNYIEPKEGERADVSSFPIVDSFILTLSKEDKEIIKNDYDKIVSKIKEGKADQISESDTDYLSACTKGKNSLVRTKQPFSSVEAKPRAFAFKQSFITTLIRKNISDEHFESVISKVKNYDGNFEKFVIDKLKKWYGKSENELKIAFNIKTDAKNKFSMYINRILNVSNLEQSEEFQKANISVKTIRIENNNIIRENVSFPQMSFIEIANTDWIDSSIRDYFIEKRFLFVSFRKLDENYVFEKAKFYNLPLEIIDEFVGYTYKKTQKILQAGEIVKKVVIAGKVKKHLTNFVGSKENPICHIRPHATNFEDRIALPVKDKLTNFEKYEKQCFWLDRRFIKSILDDYDKEYIIKARKRLNENK